MLKSVRISRDGHGHAGQTHMREDAMIKDLLMISAFTLIFMVSASAQDGMRRGDQRFMAQQQRRDRYRPALVKCSENEKRQQGRQHQQERRPPHCVSPQIRERLRWSNEGVDDARALWAEA